MKVKMLSDKHDIVSFKNNQGDTLYGVVHIPPEGTNKKVGVNLLNPGIKNRVAPHRLNVKISREISKMGYYVLRFDPHGIGDSAGRLIGETVPMVWRQIQKGLFVDDILASNEYFRRKYNLKDILLAGMCGGAISGILAAKKDKNIKNLILIDIPINLDGNEKTFTDQINSKREAERVLHRYSGKILNWESIYRLLTLKSDYSAILRALNIKIKSLPGLKKLQKRKNKVQFNPKFNYKFLESFKSLVKRDVKFQFIIAENDPGTGIFYEDFLNNYLQKNKKMLSNTEIVEIKNANHIYSLKQNQNELINKIKNFLQNIS